MVELASYRKESFDKFMEKTASRLVGNTGYNEFVIIRYRYLKGDRKDIGTTLAAEAEQLLKEQFIMCAPRAIDAYKNTLMYAFFVSFAV